MELSRIAGFKPVSPKVTESSGKKFSAPPLKFEVVLLSQIPPLVPCQVRSSGRAVELRVMALLLPVP